MKNYQTDVVETIYDNHSCLVWNYYNDEVDEQGYNKLTLVVETPTLREEDEDNERNRYLFMNMIEEYLLG